MRLHVICLDSPYPDNYGGAIDMYHKLRALHAAGVRVVLHVYLYNGGKPSKELEDISETVHYYVRTTGWRKQFSMKPYVVNSRSDARLLDNLNADTSPILFEGIQSCYLLTHPSLAHRIKIVRMHNVEHEYYKRLGKSMKFGLPMFFHLVESFRLKRYEKTLRHAEYILPITEADTEYYRKMFPGVSVQLLNCFFDDKYPATDGDVSKIVAEPYLFYHGNLFLSENNRVALFLIREVLPKLDAAYRKLVIAGRKPPQWLVEEAQNTEGVTLIADPSQEVMDALLSNSSINILVTFQPTGIKLKLLNALTHSYGHCVANSEMLHSTHLDPLCLQAEGVDDIVRYATEYLGSKITEAEMQHRYAHIKSCGFNDVSGIVKLLSET